MADLILESIGITGPIASIVSDIGGDLFSNYINSGIHNLFNRESTVISSYNAHIQQSAYGIPIPEVFGTVKLHGNVIWVDEFKKITSQTQSIKGNSKAHINSIAYYGTFAIAICKGRIDSVKNIYANGQKIDISNIVIHYGTETQLQDPIIYAKKADTPAYRGIAYAVFNNFSLQEYGNTLPSFEFEVQRFSELIAQDDIENQITGINLGPGTGKFVYSTKIMSESQGEYINGTWISRGENKAINTYASAQQADILTTLDRIKIELPKLQWITIAPCWFGTSKDANTCNIQPGIENNISSSRTEPYQWTVGTYTSTNAYVISKDAQKRPRYGQTPADQEILDIVVELKKRGYKVAIIPTILIDTPEKPWRGYITGTRAEIQSFMQKKYATVINHYSTLLKNSNIDAFFVGSELRGITTVEDNGIYPGAIEIGKLITTSKAILGSGTKVSYQANWDEYHSTYNSNGQQRYPLDHHVWNIADVVGISAYFPIVDAYMPRYSQAMIEQGWVSGEGYDYYYDLSGVQQKFTDPKYAWKNIEYWWQNSHYEDQIKNPDGTTSNNIKTPWIKKPIWFCEIGAPSVDNCATTPNVFVNPTSIDSGLPKYSRGNVDEEAQSIYLKGTLSKWKNSGMVQYMSTWTHDARPYDQFPTLINTWSDGNTWELGHWIQGKKLGSPTLGNVLSYLLKKSQNTSIDVSALNTPIHGMISTSSNLHLVAHLQTLYNFYLQSSSGTLKFVYTGGIINILQQDIISIEKSINSQNTISQVRISYYDRFNNYKISTQQVSSIDAQGKILNIGSNSVLASNHAKAIAYHILKNQSHEQLILELPFKYISIEHCDVIIYQQEKFLVLECDIKNQIKLKCIPYLDNSSNIKPNDIQQISILENQPAITVMKILDIPSLSAEDDIPKIKFAISSSASKWPGANIYSSLDGGSSYSLITRSIQAATMGKIITGFDAGSSTIIDTKNTFTVSIIGNKELSGTNETGLFNGQNLALIGSEIIQFTKAVLFKNGQYTISKLLRGRSGTIPQKHIPGEDFVLLDSSILDLDVTLDALNVPSSYSAVTFHEKLEHNHPIAFTYTGINLKPLSPTHVQQEMTQGQDIVISWTRRARINAALKSNIDVPLDEKYEKYEIDILKNGSTIRTIAIQDATTVIYTVTQQITDFGAHQKSISANIYQISDRIGRGFPAALTR